MDGFAEPFSMRESIFRVMRSPQSCRWESPADNRAFLIFSPMVILLPPFASIIPRLGRKCYINKKFICYFPEIAI
jgi:hypothetical protein